MESLAEILSNVLIQAKERRAQTGPETLTIDSPPPQCEVCKGTSWVMRGVAKTLSPCPGCRDVKEEMKVQLLNAANMPSLSAEAGKTLANFKINEGNKAAYTTAKDFCEVDIPHKILTLVGPPGVGKSHLLEAVAWEYLSRGASVRYEYAPLWMDRLRSTFKDGASETYDQVINLQRNVDLLILDDVGAERTTPYAAEQLTKVIDQRYNHSSNGRVAISTNLDEKQLAKHTEPRLVDRLFAYRDLARVAFIGGESFRTGTQWK